ncbi:unnamed protein product [Pneumocystis jirovecii]|uniref:SRR1-like domain-containing protein n=1 Tax=Pneumocystis jirovecii TaxID=42068 RepID=L0PGR8_PNEJI|nr:unnamed protein product [Pneumocystis jirovecii]
MSASGEFKYVYHKKKKRKEKKTLEWLFLQYEIQTEVLIASGFYYVSSSFIFTNIISKLIFSKRSIRISRLVMLGLGSFQDSLRSITQLSFGIKIAERLGLKEKIEAYDPVFTFLDCQLLKKLNINFNLHNSLDFLYNAEQPVIFYMPHCPISLYELLLKENWSPKKLCNIFLIGNNLTTYDLTIKNTKKKKYPFVFKACPMFESIPLSEDYEQPETFNNLAFQWCERDIVKKMINLNNDECKT